MSVPQPPRPIPPPAEANRAKRRRTLNSFMRLPLFSASALPRAVAICHATA